MCCLGTWHLSTFSLYLLSWDVDFATVMLGVHKGSHGLLSLKHASHYFPPLFLSTSLFPLSLILSLSLPQCLQMKPVFSSQKIIFSFQFWISIMCSPHSFLHILVGSLIFLYLLTEISWFLIVQIIILLELILYWIK